MMHRLAMLVNSRLIEFNTVYVQDDGLLHGAVGDALLMAGLAGQVRCFPQMNGRGDCLYAFEAVLPDVKGRPRFWVVFPNLAESGVHSLKPMSWEDAFQAASVVQSAEYAVSALKDILLARYPEWPQADMVLRLAILAEIFENLPWSALVALVTPSYGTQEIETIDGSKKSGVIEDIVVSMADGVNFIIDSDPCRPWPYVMETGMMRVSGSKTVKGDVVPYEEYFDYELPMVGRA